MIESIFLVESVREKHRNAPLFAERERYLAYLFEIGAQRERLRSVARMLLHVVRLLKLESSRPVGMDEILQGCQRWLADPSASRQRKSCIASSYNFQLAATNWLRFQGCLIGNPRPEPPFHNLLSEFLNDMHSQRGLSLKTILHYKSRLLPFLNSLKSRCPDFSNVQISDVDEYLQTLRFEGKSRSSIVAYCTALRTFFSYAEQRQWCSIGIRDSIIRPRLPRIAENLSGPPWEDVRRVIASIGNLKPTDLRAKAMFLLFAVYGFRSAEVSGLTLEDIDWRRGIITVRRAKRGMTQRFPLQSEVGEAIALYLEKARPQCSCRALFVTRNQPYRPVLGSMPMIISCRIKRLGIVAQQYGPHTLRRACATQLLRTGSSIKDVADFLGHRDLRSVCIYAKYDPTSLKNVAKFSLRGVL